MKCLKFNFAFLLVSYLSSLVFAETVVYPKHPRLLFRDTDVPKIKERIKDPMFAPLYDAMLRWADDFIEKKGSRGDITIFGFLYQMTKDKKYLDEAVRLLNKQPPYEKQFLHPTLEVKYTYDLIYNGMSEENQAKFAQKLLRMHLANKYYRNGPMGMHQTVNEGSVSLAVWGDRGVDMDMLKKRFKKERDWYKTEYFRRGNTIAQRWGGWHRSFECRCWRKFVARFAELWLNATGEDTFDNPLIRSHGAWYLYHMLPGFRDSKNFRLTPDSYTSFGQSIDVNDWDNTLILGKRLNEGLSMWWWEQPLSRNRIWGFHAYKNFFKTLKFDGLEEKDIMRLARTGIFWRIILYYDANIPKLEPDLFPEDAYHEGMGLVSMRSGWDDQAAFAFFHCGRFASGKPDDLDNNNFIIYRNGFLTADGWPNGKTAHYGYEWDNYRRRTIAHNLITVYDPDEPLKNFWSQYARERFPERKAGKADSNDGGQMGQFMYKLDPDLHPWKEEGKTNIYLPHGYIKGFRTHPNYTYMRGDATESYSSHKLSAYTREFVFLKPGIFVVFDRVVSTKKEFKKTWHIHPMQEPTLKDNTFRWQAYRPRTNYSPEKNPLGWLVGTTLLPEKSKSEIIGGKGKECWVNGKNYHTVRGNDVSKGHFTKQDENEWKHSWRIDVQEQEPQKETFYLHVLETFEDEPKKTAKIELIKSNDEVGAKIHYNNQQWFVSFAKTGQGGGKIQLTDGEKSIVHETLPTEVEDTYKNWNTDKRYQQWISDSRFRLVIPKEEQQLKK